jgi:hypothetical protein
MARKYVTSQLAVYKGEMIYTSCIWVFCFDSPKCVLDFGLMTSPDKDTP